MSFKLCALVVLSVVLYTSTPAFAGVVRADSTPNQTTEKSIDEALADPQTTESQLAESTTIQDIGGEDRATKNAAASLDPAPGTLEGIEITLETIEDKAAKMQKNEEDNKSTEEAKSSEEDTNESETEESKNETAVSRGEGASIKVNAHESDDLEKEAPQSSVESIQEPQRSSKLLLLSTPRLVREQEENIAEPEDVDLNTAVSTDETTELSIEVETETPKYNEEEDKKPGFITRVRDAIFGKKSADETTEQTKPQTEEDVKVDDDKEKQITTTEQETQTEGDTASPAAADEMPAQHNNNAASAVLIETEPEYVIFDSDVAHLEHFGSFTHIESDEHLQPIVHSVEEVPTHFEEPLLFTSSYSHAW